MEVKYIKKIEQSYYTCELCGERIEAGDRDICLVYGKTEIDGVMKRPEKPQYHFHETCLQDHIEKEILNP